MIYWSCLHMLETAGKCDNWPILFRVANISKLLVFNTFAHVANVTKPLILNNLVGSGKFDQTLNIGQFCLERQIWSKSKSWKNLHRVTNVIKLLLLNMSTRIANISEGKVLNKFAWGSKCDQTLTIERVCSGIAIIIKVQVLTDFASGGKMC